MIKCLFALMVCCLLFSGCATVGQGNTAGNVRTKKEVYIGVATIDTEKGVKVINTAPGDPASEVGLLPDDIIKQINGIDVSNFKQFIAMIRNLKPYSGAKLMVVHNGQIKQLTVYPKQREMPADVDFRPSRKIAELLSTNNKVSLLIIVGGVSNAMRNYTKNTEWETGVRNKLQSSTENNYLHFSDYPDFKIVDRSKTEEVLKEIKFSLSGMVSDELRTQVSKMTGATYILYITFCRYSSAENGYSDETTERLINIETGEVAASDTTRLIQNKQ